LPLEVICVNFWRFSSIFATNFDPLFFDNGKGRESVMRYA